MDSLLRELESVQPRSDLRRRLHLPGGRTVAVNWPTSCSATRHVKATDRRAPVVCPGSDAGLLDD